MGSNENCYYLPSKHRSHESCNWILEKMTNASAFDLGHAMDGALSDIIIAVGDSLPNQRGSGVGFAGEKTELHCWAEVMSQGVPLLVKFNAVVEQKNRVHISMETGSRNGTDMRELAQHSICGSGPRKLMEELRSFFSFGSYETLNSTVNKRSGSPTKDIIPIPNKSCLVSETIITQLWNILFQSFLSIMFVVKNTQPTLRGMHLQFYNTPDIFLTSSEISTGTHVLVLQFCAQKQKGKVEIFGDIDSEHGSTLKTLVPVTVVDEELVDVELLRIAKAFAAGCEQEIAFISEKLGSEGAELRGQELRGHNT